MNAVVPLPATAAFEAASAELFTAHNTERAHVALIHDPALPWVVRKGGKLPTILEPRYQTAGGGRMRRARAEPCARAYARQRPSWPRLRVAEAAYSYRRGERQGRLSGRLFRGTTPE
jgi:hypothetical protein